MIEVTMGEVKSLVIFHQVDGEKLCGKGLKIIEIDLWTWWLDLMTRPEGNKQIAKIFFFVFDNF